MAEQHPLPAQRKGDWAAPKLVRLGTIRDIAGPKGGRLTNGINSNRIPS